MATYPGSNIPINDLSNTRLNSIIDNLLTPKLMAFREICIYDEKATLMSDGSTWRVTYSNWLPRFDLGVRKNGQSLGPGGGYENVNYCDGTLTAGAIDFGPDGRSKDSLELTYQFDYFPAVVLAGYLYAAIETVNTGAAGPPTDFGFDSNNEPPAYWDGVLSDLAFAMAMERLILDYDLWKGRLVFALNPGDVYDGSGSGSNVVSQLELLKKNAEERAQNTLDNPKFKIGGNITSAPTAVYYSAVRGIGGRSSGCLGPGGKVISGKLRGFGRNRLF
jgi:hypothetical protein